MANYSKLIILLSIVISFQACEKTSEIEPIPTKSSKPIVVNQINQKIKDSYKIDFGPGAKGFETDLAPGAKGFELELGPGAKGFQDFFGPGAKGFSTVNFNIVIPDNLINSNLEPFNTLSLETKQNNHSTYNSLYINKINIQIMKNKEVVSKIEVLPINQKIQFGFALIPDNYDLVIKPSGNLDVSKTTYTNFEAKNLHTQEIRIEPVSNTLRPEDFDIEVLTRSEKLDFQ